MGTHPIFESDFDCLTDFFFAKMTRTFFVGGNWKMNGSKAMIDTIAENLNQTKVPQNVEVVCGAPDVFLTYAQSKITNPSVQVSAQNCYKAGKGAFTGETAPEMLKDLGINWVILGHSERRHVFGESDELIGEKVKKALETGLNIIPCIGEKLEKSSIIKWILSQRTFLIGQKLSSPMNRSGLSVPEKSRLLNRLKKFTKN